MDEHREQIGERVRLARKARGWNAATLAQKAGVAPNTLSNIERGLGYQDGSLRKVMDVLKLDPLAPPPSLDYPADVELARAWVGAHLVAQSPEERRETIEAVFGFLIARSLKRHPAPDVQTSTPEPGPSRPSGGTARVDVGSASKTRSPTIAIVSD
jgi:transcriptional regulator with XRE-family HTH domain